MINKLTRFSLHFYYILPFQKRHFHPSYNYNLLCAKEKLIIADYHCKNTAFQTICSFFFSNQEKRCFCALCFDELGLSEHICQRAPDLSESIISSGYLLPRNYISNSVLHPTHVASKPGLVIAPIIHQHPFSSPYSRSLGATKFNQPLPTLRVS
jgi:proteasome lid subunit RPN8/RPN11